MSNIINKLQSCELIKPPSWLANSIQYEIYSGSISYGSNVDSSDIDLIGFCIPKKEMIFPHLSGEILGFGKQTKRFDQYQNNHIVCDNIKYDITIYSIVKYFNLAMECNPNIIDTLFVNNNVITFITKIGQMVRENRKLFLSKNAWKKFKGYAFSQLDKGKNAINNKDIITIWQFEDASGIDRSTKIEEVEEEINIRTGKSNNIVNEEKFKNIDLKSLQLYHSLYLNIKGTRAEKTKVLGQDFKFFSHLIRLILELKMILEECDLDVSRNGQLLKQIKNGEWTVNQIYEFVEKSEKELEKLYVNTKLNEQPDENKIKDLLLTCLEEYFGNLNNCIKNLSKYEKTILKIKELISEF